MSLPAQPAPEPLPNADCLADRTCKFLYDLTGSRWLSEGGYYLLVKPVRILLIVLGAMIIRAVLNHGIDKFVTRTVKGRTILRPIREKVPSSVAAATTVFADRRVQRAEALGSVLKSVVTATVFSIAFLIVLSEFEINVGPLLASLGVAGVALGFGAQSLVKDLIAGMFMLIEDQYGVGDVIDTGEALGVVESVGLRIVSVRDIHGVLWHVRNGAIIRVGNKSQGWATIVVDIPIGFVGVDKATAVLRRAVEGFAHDPQYSGYLLESPQVLGVESVSMDGVMIRTVCKTSTDQQWDVQRELRRRLTEAIEASGIAAQMQAYRSLRALLPMQEPPQGR
ncbi:mechanosensitive ion channel family protein [Catellatospora bangladeshensis]|uniref:Mechanosensitive ion channel protein MscS n=2 Tax=Catellatospora bangladeshensis TaxID=310355 RepID=A0A8J3JLC0_9ACTN|nr:mechanosensitive ion channel family protein [Catellatospora bangladeshensis]GIF84599.1 mechanosensitive ion channel protein MscS [Catellatospora bangladeshensis]